jgi:filamentous hemagglutinin
MAVTRIKNNQITDATVVANAKLVDYSISSAKLANNLTYNSDLTITGNLTVQGNSTAIDTTITTIEDPIIVLASTQTSGAPAVDIGYLGFRGNQSNIAFVWDESAGQFVTAFTSTGESNTTITITSYANLQIGNLSLTGNILNSTLNVTGNITGGNLLTPGLISSTSTITSAANITGGNVLTGGLISATSTITSAANITGGNVLTGGLISATGNITGGNLLTSGSGGAISGTGNITGGNLLTGGLISAAGNITSGSGSFFIGNGSQLTGVAATSANFPISNGTSNINAAVNANITVGVAGTSNVAVFADSGVFVTGVASVSANITGGNLATGGTVSATANVTGGNVLTGGLISAGGNITSATNVNTPNVVGATGLSVSTGSGNINLSPTSGNIVVNNTYINGVTNPVQNQDVATKIYVDNAVSTQIAYHQAVTVATTSNLATATGGTITYTQPNGAANGVGALLTTTGAFNLIDTANVQTVGTRIMVKNEGNAVFNGVYTWANATNIVRSTDTDQYGPNSSEELSINDYFFVASGNVNKGSAYVVDAPSGTITFGTSNITFAQFSSSQTYTAGNGISLYGTVISTVYDNSTIGINGSNQLYIPANAPLTTPNIGAATGTSLSVTGAVDAGTTMSATANITGGNVLTGGLISATSTITSAANVIGGNVLTGGLISATSTITSAANVIGGNVLTGGLISATANITGGNVLTGGLISATSTITSAANVIGGNLTTAGQVSATANITGGNVLTGGLISATANITGGNVLTGGLISATSTITSAANITGGNVLTGGLVSATGTGTFGNITVGLDSIDSANSRITVNSTSADTDIAFNADTVANVFYIDAGTGTASFGASTQVTDSIVNFATTTSIKAPVGNTAQRPATGVTGMVRFNTTSNALEVYDNSAWTSVGVPVFTVIADQQFNGDGSTVAFTLSTSQTTNSCIVSINGVVQIPTLAYSVSTTTLTFTEAPLSGDVIDVRQITTTTSVTSIANSSGNAVIAVSPTSAQTNVTGDLSVTGSILGGNINSTAITSGTSNMAIVSSGGNIRGNVAGTTVMTISPGLVDIVGNLTVSGNATLSGNILGDRIQNGTTSLDIQTASGNANINIGGTGNLAVFAPGNLLMTGNITPTANITYDLGTNTNRWKDLWLSNSTIYLGNSQISANATSLIFTNPSGGQTVLAGATAGITGATVSASGNITGANVIATANIAVGTGAGNLQIGADTANVGSNAIHFTNPASAGNITFLANVGGTITEVFKGLGAGGFSVVGNISTGNTITAGGNISGANVIATTDIYTPEIVKTGSNAVGNIGQSSNYFNTVFAQATSALYADLAEKYVADAEYAPGTVVVFGGTHEVTVNATDADRKVAGVVSTNPSYIMNAGLDGEYVATVALTGRVPTLVIGTVRKGDLMVAAGLGRARAEADPRVGTVIGKALEDFDGAEGTIEVVVGRF